MSEVSQKKTVGTDLTVGPVFPLLVTFAIPMILASLVQQLYSMVDLIVIGKFVGSVGTVGVSNGGELSDLITYFTSGFSIAGQIYIAQLAGAKKFEKLKSAVGTFITLMMIASVAVTVGSIVFYREFLLLLQCPDEAFVSAASYLLITAIGFPFIFGYNAICAVLRGMGEAKRPLLFVSIAATVNIFLDLLLVAVFRMDAAGTAIATVASQIGAFIASFIYFYRRRESVGFQSVRSMLILNRHDLCVIFRLGIPQLVRAFCVHGSMFWVKSNINSYGMVASATYSIGNKIEKLMTIFRQNTTGAGGAMMGQNIGARKLGRVQEIMRKVLMLALAIGIVEAILFWIIPEQLYFAFTDDPLVIEFGKAFLRIMSVGCIVAGFSSSMKSISTGAGVATLSLALGILDGVCRIAICLVFVEVFQQGVQSYFWGAALCQLIPGLLAMAYYLSGRWKTKKLLS